LKHDIISQSRKSQICEEIDKEIEEALIYTNESPYPDETELIKDVFKT